MLDTDKKRIDRLTVILIRLQSKRFIKADKLAGVFGVSNRTIYRDMKTLEQAGVPIFSEEGKGFSVMDDFRIPPIMFTEEEANALLTAEMIIQASKDTSLIDKFAAAILKVKAVIPTTIKQRTEQLEQKMGISNVYIDASPKSRFLLDVQKALLGFLVINIDYTDQTGQKSVRSLQPFAIYSNKNNEWVMVAFCRLRTEFRSFSLLNISRMDISSETFEPHDLTFEQYLQKTFGNKNG